MHANLQQENSKKIEGKVLFFEASDSWSYFKQKISMYIVQYTVYAKSNKSVH